PLGPDGGPAVPFGMLCGIGPINFTQVPHHAGCRSEMAHILAIEAALTPGPPSSYGQQKGDGEDRPEMVAAQGRRTAARVLGPCCASMPGSKRTSKEG